MMDTAILVAAEAYAKMIGNMSVEDVLLEIQQGNDVVKRSVLALMEVTVNGNV